MKKVSLLFFGAFLFTAFMCRSQALSSFDEQLKVNYQNNVCPSSSLSVSADVGNLDPSLISSYFFQYTTDTTLDESLYLSVVSSESIDTIESVPTSDFFIRLMVSVTGSTNQTYGTWSLVNVIPDIAVGQLDPASLYPGELYYPSIPFSGASGFFNYRWKVIYDNSDTVYLPGAESDTLVFSTPGNYLLEVSDSMCPNINTLSPAVSLSFHPLVAGSLLLKDATLPWDSATVAFQTPPTGGDGSYTFSWQISNDDTSFSNIDNIDTNAYSLRLDTIPAPCFVRAIVSSANSLVDTTPSLFITPYLFDTLSLAISDSILCFNSIPDTLALLPITVDSNLNLAYQWQLLQPSGWSNIDSAVSDFIIPLADNLSHSYRLAVSDTLLNNIQFSNAVTITFYDSIVAPQLFNTTVDTLCYASRPVALDSNVAASGADNSFSYQWQKRSLDGEWVDIDGSVDIAGYLPDTLYSTTLFRLKATNAFCQHTSFSDSIQINVYGKLTPPSIANATNGYICYGTSPANFTIAVPAHGGNEAFSYMWQRQDGSLWISTGDTSQVFQPGNLTQNTNYRLLATSLAGCGDTVSSGSTIYVHDSITAPQITNTTPNTICFASAPNALNSNSAATGSDGLFTYQWLKRGENGIWDTIDNATSIASYQPQTLYDTTWFRILAVNSKCNITSPSNEIQITVYDSITAPQITNTTPDTICYGATPLALNSNTAATGSNNLFSYQWQKRTLDGTWNDIADSVDLASCMPGTLYTTTLYRLKATNAFCQHTSFSDSIQINVYGKLVPPSIANATNGTICFGTEPAPFTIAVPAHGGNEGFSYLWQRQENSQWISTGDTGMVFQPGNLIQNTKYRLLATSLAGCGDTVSSGSTIYVHDSITPPQITNTTPNTICFASAPNAINSNSAATGSDGLFTYQWLKRGDNGIWDTIDNATSLASYQPQTLYDTTWFRILAFNTKCNIISPSNEIQITVYDSITAPQITNTTPDTICYGATPLALNSNTAATGSDNLFSYQWQKRTLDGTWNDIADSVDLASCMPGTLYTTTLYRLKATNAYCQHTSFSDSIQINVYNNLTPPSIANATNGTICYGTSPANFTIAIPAHGGNEGFSYLWQRQENSQWISTGDTGLVFQPGNLIQNTKYRLLATSLAGCGDTVSSGSTIYVHDSITPPQITNTTPNTICFASAPNALNSNSAATGSDGLFSYQWQNRGNNGTWNTIVNATSLASYQPETLYDTTWYRILAVNSKCNITSPSNEIQITVYDSIVAPQVFNTTPDTICFGASPLALNSNIAATGSDNLFSYQWQKRTLDGAWNDIVDSVNLASCMPGTLYATTLYRLKATNAFCQHTSFSDSVQINVYGKLVPPSIANATNGTICFGTEPAPFTIAVPAHGGNEAFSYMWQRQDSSLWISTGDTSQVFQPGNLMQNTKYRLLATSLAGCGDTASSGATIFVYPEFHNAELPSYNTVECYGQSFSVTRTDADGGDGVYTYTWYRSNDGSDWQEFSNETATYSGTANNSEYIKVNTYNKCGEGDSRTHHIVVNPLPERKTLSGDSILDCSNMTELEYWVDNDKNESYYWSLDPRDGEILGSIDSSHVLIHWNDGVSSAILTLDVTIYQTQCHDSFSYPVNINTDNRAPDKTNIVLKKGARILICADTTPGAHYEWGYINIVNGKETMIPNSDYRYVQIPEGLDMNNYDFFVEVWYGKAPCRTRTYYRKDEQGDDWWSGDKNAPTLKMMPNPSQGDVAYSLDADIDGVYQVDVYNAVGKLVFSQSDNDFIRDTAVKLRKHLDPGIYLVTITTTNGVLTQKIIVK